MITISIIILTCVISFSAFNNHQIADKLCFYPYGMKRSSNEYFRFISVAFVHKDITHLAFNMLTLFFFGRNLEGTVFTETQFILLYLSSIVVAGVPDYMQQKDNPNYSAVGASGAISAILFSSILFNPWGVLYLNFFIPLYAILFGVGYLAYSYYMSKKGGDNIGHLAHYSGALYGVAFTLIVEPRSLSYFLTTVGHPPFLH